AFLLLQGVVVRQGRGHQLERQRRHVEVEALRDAHRRLEKLDLRLLEDLGRRRHQCGRRRREDLGVPVQDRVALEHGAQRLALGRRLEVALAVEFDQQAAALRLGRLGRRVQDAEGALLELDALAPEARALQEQHVGLVEGDARAVDDELRARGRRRRVERIVHDEGLVRGGQVEAVPARDGVAGHYYWVELIKRSV
ncbi:unnamed protein product, partial [Pelagomonas calceolata]